MSFHDSDGPIDNKLTEEIWSNEIVRQLAGAQKTKKPLDNMILLLVIMSAVGGFGGGFIAAQFITGGL
jgi:hypothetical protein